MTYLKHIEFEENVREIEIINKIGTTKEDIHIIAGEPMMGKNVDQDLVATIDLSCVIVLENLEQLQETECIRCGKCTKYCPVNISPVLIKDNKKKKCPSESFFFLMGM